MLILLPSVLASTALPTLPACQDGLLQDIHPGQSIQTELEPGPALIANLPGGFLMSLKSPSFGRELWFSDTTEAGTRRIADLGIGTAWGEAYDREMLPDGSWLLACNASFWNGELFRLDPNSLEVELVRDIEPGTSSASVAGFVSWKGLVWFYATSAASGRELWRSDGTAAGTVQPFDVNPLGGISNGTDGLQPTTDVLYFTTTSPTRALYALSDPNGTPVLIADASLASGGFGLGSDFSMLGSLGDRLLFNFDDGVHGQELWITDGTPAGTSLFLDILPGPEGSKPNLIASNDSEVWFSAIRPGQGREISRTDGTLAGTVDMQEIVPGASGGFSSTASGVLLPGGIYLPGTSLGLFGPFSGPLVLPLNGTSFEALVPGLSSAQFVEHAGSVYFRGFQGSTATPFYRTDGTALGTVVATDLELPGSPPLNLLGSTPFGLLVSAEDPTSGSQLHLFDEVSGQFALIGHFSSGLVGTGSFSGAGVTFQGRHYFSAQSPVTGFEPWSTDGTPSGTLLAQNLVAGSASSGFVPLVALGGQLIYSAKSTSTGATDLWALSGSFGEAERLTSFPGFASGLSVLATETIGSTAYFLASNQAFPFETQIWSSDGTKDGTELVFPPAGSEFTVESAFGEFAAVGDTLWFVAEDASHGRELWKSDGTASGTQLAFDLEPGSAESWPQSLTAFGNQLFFSAEVTGTGREPYAIAADGSLVFLGDLRPGNFGCIPAEPVALDDRLIFFANDGTFGQELFATDGTPSGTFRIGDLSPGFFGFSTERLPVRAGDYVFFYVPRPGGGTFELWRTAGTVESTQLIAGTMASGTALQRNPLSPLGSASAVSFQQFDTIHGAELWTATSAPGSAALAADLRPGFDSSQPTATGRVGDRLIFAAENEFIGREPHALSLTGLGGFVAEPFGSPCGNARIDTAGEVRLLSPFQILLEADPNLTATLGFATQSTFVPLGGGCGFNLPLNFVPLGNVQTSATGQAALPFFVPDNPAFVGLPFYAQWLVYKPGGEVLGLLDLSEGIELILGT